MERNKKLPKIKKFEHEAHFYKHLFNLLAILYPTATFKEKKIIFQDKAFKGVDIHITNSRLHANTSQEFRLRNDKFATSGNAFLEVVNAQYEWKGTSGYGYVYPRDRDMFQDSELGMEQKACHFVVVLQVVLQFLKTK